MSNFFFIFRSMKNREKEVRTPKRPIRKKKKEDFLNPSSLFSLFWIIVAVTRGTTHYAKLEMISMIPIAEPKTFLCTTIGIAATMTLA